ncbi:MAG TPA: cytidine deaminase [Pyrinomonadaceae bacterium]|jgi:cytidine deaminase
MSHSDQELIDAATRVRENSYAPFSKFKVGAALESDDGDIVVGSNVESASYGLTVCAERVAVWNAISHGKRKITKIAVVTDADDLTPPCGVCRQIIWEFGGDIPVLFANLNGKVETVQMRDLLPRAFDTKFLK